MTRRLLLCTDLDRTLLPNGAQPESPEVRDRLRQLAARPEVTLAYATGRHLALAMEAITDFDMPIPDFIIGDVGSSIYRVEGGKGVPWEDWWREIAPGWAGATRDDLADLFRDLDDLRLQEAEKQGRFKLSFYAPHDLDHRALIAEMDRRLVARKVAADLIWSIDETEPSGLLDIVPQAATKLHAVRFIMERSGFSRAESVFCGDSGNDMPVLGSALQAVLVANATPSVVAQALDLAEKNATLSSLYIARGGFKGMNGYYGAGILEGLAHYRPETAGWYD